MGSSEFCWELKEWPRLSVISSALLPPLLRLALQGLQVPPCRVQSVSQWEELKGDLKAWGKQKPEILLARGRSLLDLSMSSHLVIRGTCCDRFGMSPQAPPTSPEPVPQDWSCWWWFFQYPGCSFHSPLSHPLASPNSCTELISLKTLLWFCFLDQRKC